MSVVVVAVTKFQAPDEGHFPDHRSRRRKKCESRGPLLASKFLQNVYGNIHCRFLQKPEDFGGLLLFFLRIYVK